MNRKIGMLFVCFILTTTLSGFLTSDIRSADSQPQINEKSKTLTLFETTTLYDDNFQEVANIGPQEVRVLGTSSHRVGYGQGYRATTYLISTWIGYKWILPDPDRALFGKEEPMDKYLELSRDLILYDDPGLVSQAGKIDKGTVKAVARWDKHYKIVTTQGEKWIAPGITDYADIKPLDGKIQLTAPQTKLYRFPNIFPSSNDTGSSVTPQSMHITAVYQNWYRADSWLGPVWFRLHELDATDVNNDIEVGFIMRDYNENETQLQAKVQLGPKWRDSDETIPVGFYVYFYNENGERIGTSSSANLRLKGKEVETADLTVDSKVDEYAFATVQVGMFNRKIAYEVNPRDPMAVRDSTNQDLSVGGIRVSQEGEFSVVRGQYSYKLSGEHSLVTELQFLNSAGEIIGRVPLNLKFDATYSGSHSLSPFERVVPANVLNYTSVNLKVLDS